MASLKTFRYEDAGKMLEHTNRKHAQTRDEHIDTVRSYTNRKLSPDRGMEDTEYLDKRISEVAHTNRKTLKVMGSWVVTVPKDILYEKTALVDSFFDGVYDFMTDRYGEENTISCWVHYDEAVPHMHYNFVPVVYDEALMQERINASKCIPYGSLGQFHWDMKDYLDQRFGFSVNVAVNAVRGEGDLSVLQLKVRTLTDEIGRLEGKRDELISSLEISEKVSDMVLRETDEGVIVSREDLGRLMNNARAYELYRPLLSGITEKERTANELVAEGMKDLSLAYELFGISQRRLFEELERREAILAVRKVMADELEEVLARSREFLTELRSSFIITSDTSASRDLDMLLDKLSCRSEDMIKAVNGIEKLTGTVLAGQREALLSSFDERYELLLRENSSLRKQNDILMELRRVLTSSEDGGNTGEEKYAYGRESAEELEELLREETEEYRNIFDTGEDLSRQETIRIRQPSF